VIKIFVGTSSNGEDAVAEKTLEYSLKKHSSEELEVIFMRNNDSYLGTFNSNGWATPFTNLRWTIPEYCNFTGRAIYMDVDQLNLKDISQLYHIDLQGKPFASREDRLCVMVIDCAAMKPLLQPISVIKNTPTYGNNIYWEIVKKSHHFDTRWNCLDGEGRAIEDIWHLHFTSMPTQPWKPAWFRGVTKAHWRQDLVDLWERYKIEAYANT
jgi:hypothetical protein